MTSMIGKRIRNARLNCSMTQKELGILLGYPEKTAEIRISQYENDNRTPKANTLQTIADILGVSVAYLTTPSPSSPEEIILLLHELREQGKIQVVYPHEQPPCAASYMPRICVAFKDDQVNNFLAGFASHTYLMQHMSEGEK